MVAGLNATENQWPFFAFLATPKKYCGATIVHKRFIVTTASCIQGTQPDKITVRVGSMKRPRAEKVKVRLVCITSGYQKLGPNAYDEDFAIMMLKEPLKFKSNIRPVRLTKESDARTDWFKYAKCHVIGAGASNKSLQVSKWVQYREVKFHDCVEGEPDKSVLCYRHLGEVGSLACRGDYGGPIVCERDGHRELVGLVSYGPEVCAPVGAALGLMRAANFQRFLNTTFFDCVNWLNSELANEPQTYRSARATSSELLEAKFLAC